MTRHAAIAAAAGVLLILIAAVGTGAIIGGHQNPNASPTASPSATPRSTPSGTPGPTRTPTPTVGPQTPTAVPFPTPPPGCLPSPSGCGHEPAAPSATPGLGNYGTGGMLGGQR